jgi:CHAT domain-containing protein/tetratricopeptide (TPR) repeat protein
VIPLKEIIGNPPAPLAQAASHGLWPTRRVCWGVLNSKPLKFCTIRRLSIAGSFALITSTTLLARLLIGLPTFKPVEKFSLNLLFSAGLLPAVAQTQDVRKSQADNLLKGGIEQYNNNQLKAAVQSCQQALDIYRAINDQSRQADTLNCLGFAYRQLGDHGKAIQYREQHKDLILKIGDPEAKAKSLGDLGITYAEVGDYDRANDYLNQSLKIAQKIHNLQIEGEALANLGATNQDLGPDHYNDAINYLNQSLAIVTKLGNLPTQSLVLYHLGVVHHALGKLSKAVGYYQQSLAIAQQIHDPPLAAAASSGLGFAYENLSKYSKAIEFHQQSIAIAQKANDQQREASALNNLGHTLLLSGNLPEAERQLRHAIEILDALRSGLNDTYKGSLFDTQVLTYNLLQQVLVAQNKFEAALEISEWGRARAFVDLMVGRLSASAQGVNALHPISSKPLTIEEIRQIAREQNATLVEYSIIPDEFVGMGKLRGKAFELFIWVVQSTGEVAFRRINLKPEKIILDDLVVKSRESIGVRGRGPSINFVPLPEMSQTKRLQQLYRLLIQPIADLLPRDPNSHVIFLPHESLFLIPFPALQDASGQYLIEQHTILTAPAIQVLALTHQQSVNVRKAGLQDVLVVGNPVMPWVAPEPKASPQPLPSLPGTEREAKAIAELLHVTPLIGKQATKTAVLLQMPNAKLIHLATHGLLDDTKRLEIPGSIALAPDPPSISLSKPDQEKGNGLLTAKEIQELKLNAELVVLSACDTGRGRITGDGVIGLSRSLITAGVPSVIVSLWSVPDAPTGDLMIEFYRNWQPGKTDKAQALRQAMLIIKKTHPNPKDWAAFTLMGEAE